MAKKAAKPQTADSSKQLITAIATVKQLQDFIRQNGGLEPALAAAERVNALIEMTGGYAQLTQALQIVGQEGAPQQ